MQKLFKAILIWSVLSSCSHSAGDMDTYRGCSLEGDAKREDVRELNVLKNRYTFPDSTQIDHSVTLEAMLAPGDDRNRFNTNKAVEITGYVLDVKVGGDESCNCHERDPQYRDTHIEIALPTNLVSENQCVIVEVTPRMREIMSKKGIDWSTDNLRNTIKGHSVKVRGWLLFDEEHSKQAENTDPDNPKDWRATCWEIHPVTSIEVVESKPL